MYLALLICSQVRTFEELNYFDTYHILLFTVSAERESSGLLFASVRLFSNMYQCTLCFQTPDEEFISSASPEVAEMPQLANTCCKGMTTRGQVLRTHVKS